MDAAWLAPSTVEQARPHRHGPGIYLPYWISTPRCTRGELPTPAFYTRPIRQREQRSRGRRRRAAGYSFDDESCGVDRCVGHLLRKIEPFHRHADPLRSGLSCGIDRERYQLASSTPQSIRARRLRRCAGAMRDAVPGDTHRNLPVASDYSVCAQHSRPIGADQPRSKCIMCRTRDRDLAGDRPGADQITSDQRRVIVWYCGPAE